MFSVQEARVSADVVCSNAHVYWNCAKRRKFGTYRHLRFISSRNNVFEIEEMVRMLKILNSFFQTQNSRVQSGSLAAMF
eukprot:2273572-Amphidinium_carterae.1